MMIKAAPAPARRLHTVGGGAPVRYNRRRRRHKNGGGGGVAAHSSSLGERRGLPQQGPGRRKRNLCILFVI